MTQTDLFPEEKAKAHAIAWASQAHQAELELCRDMAIKICASKGEVTVDDLRDLMPRMVFGPWSGSIFRDPRFICTGFVSARHAGSHARMIRRWGIKK